MIPKILRRLVPPVLFGAVLLTMAGCARKDAHQLVVGMELAYPPFEMTDEHNQPAGIGVDLARALAAYLHRELVVQNTGFVGLIPALKTGKIDLIISSMTVTADRRKSIDFSDPYMHTGICALLSAKSDVQTVADLNQPGRTVAVKEGTTGFTYAREFLPQARLAAAQRGSGVQAGSDPGQGGRVRVRPDVHLPDSPAESHDDAGNSQSPSARSRGPSASARATRRCGPRLTRFWPTSGRSTASKRSARSTSTIGMPSRTWAIRFPPEINARRPDPPFLEPRGKIT